MESETIKEHHRKRPWMWISVLISLCGVVLLIVWLMKPMPSPVVTVDLLGFQQIDNFWYATVAFTNRGQTKVYLDTSGRNSGWRAEYVTKTGRAGSWGRHFTDVLRGIAPGDGEVVNVGVSGEVEKWQVTAPFMYFKRHYSAMEFRQWMLDRNRTGALAQIAYKVAGSAMSQLPVPPTASALYTSGWLTNLPPAKVAE